MKKKEIKEKFERLNKQIEDLEKGQKDLDEITQFILEAIKKYTDEPIYRVRKSNNWYQGFFVKEYVLQYVYDNKVKEIAIYADILSAELFAYCDTHFILKNQDNECFLVDMVKGIITRIPTQLLFSEEMNSTIEGQMLKICHTGPGVLGVKHENQSSN